MLSFAYFTEHVAHILISSAVLCACILPLLSVLFSEIYASDVQHGEMPYEMKPGT
jgi:hypothetical protein